MAPTVTVNVQVNTQQRLRIIIDQSSQNAQDNHSDVRVRGILVNDSGDVQTHNTPNITRGITGTMSYSTDPFSFDCAAHDTYEFLDHTFTVTHDADGTKTVNFTVTYGRTNTDFMDDQSASATLVLTRIPKKPGPPGQPVFTNVTPTSLTVSWTACTDNGGSPIETYELCRWSGSTQSGTRTDSKANSLSRNITGLESGHTYTFAVHARNGAYDDWSDFGPDDHITLEAGGWIRVGGVWVQGLPYVRYQGFWKPATPYIRSGGVWKKLL
jgi:hypothetical protein